MAFHSFCFYFVLANVFGLARLASPAGHRLTWTLSLITTSVLAFRHLGDIPISVDLASTLGLFIIIWNAHVLSIVMSLQQPIWTESSFCRPPQGRADDKASTVPPLNEQNGCRWKQAYKLLYNSRWIGTSTEVPGTRTIHVVPRKPVEGGRECDQAIWWNGRLEKYPMSPRIRFFVIQIRHLLVIAAVNRFVSATLTTPQHHAFQPLQIDDINVSYDAYFRRIGEVTARETAIRLATVLTFIWNAYANLSGLHAALSIIFVVLLGFDTPEEWPPLFGDLRKAVSIRRFWTGFWHSLAYRPYAAIAKFVLQSLLKLKTQSPLYQPGRNFIIFMCSGISHALVARQLIPCGAKEEIWWFAVNFAAVVLESIFALMVNKAGLRPSSPAGRLVWRVCGYSWVLGFMFWSLPKVQFRQLRCVVNGGD
ncbi:hypothetical protein H2200_009876 [Cladophialophora chaetospira]|uniref:Wax synthase domain-containing protein n=1 Tax=Cladophialophora chaetospira TaxID=386627 RepID=A0AA38X3D1_9EURO|nr:hypothetical protein H2200_009876 [Cladophialophora chaetospira]